MAIKVSKVLPERRYLQVSDPSGETYVLIRQPTSAGVKERGQMLANRTPMVIDGYYHTQVNVNVEQLRLLEIWLTYEETNLKVEVLDEEGEVAETIEFQPRGQITRAEFMRRLERLMDVAYGIVVEWSQKVREVVPQWDSPFW